VVARNTAVATCWATSDGVKKGERRENDRNRIPEQSPSRDHNRRGPENHEPEGGTAVRKAEARLRCNHTGSRMRSRFPGRTDGRKLGLIELGGVCDSRTGPRSQP
jgi:hypothetical protein